MATTIRLTTDGSWRVLAKHVAGRIKLIALRTQRNAAQWATWTTQPPSDDDGMADGDPNPLDWIVRVCDAVGQPGAQEILDFLCRQFGGRFVPTSTGQGAGRLFRDPAEALPHLKAIQAEIKKEHKCTPSVLNAHLQELYLILTSYYCHTQQPDEQEVHDDHHDNA